MLALILAATIASHADAPPQFRDPRVGMAGRPETVGEYARDARACGFKVVVRRLRDADLATKQNTFLPNTQIVLFEEPYDRADQRALCFLKARKRSFIRSNVLGQPLPTEFRDLP